MSITYYQLAVASNLRVLGNLSHLLDKAATHCSEHKIEERVMLELRLFPDMFPLVRQVQLVSDMTKSCAGRLLGREPPRMEDNETDFAQLQKRIADTVAYLKTLNEADFVDCAEREVRLPWRPDQPMRGEVFLVQHALPNIYFHITTVYNILRHNGVAVGKADFVGKVS